MSLILSYKHQFADLPSNSTRSFSRFPAVLHLCASSAMSFHWFDAQEICKSIISRVNLDPELTDELFQLQKNLDRLQEIPVWIRSEQRIYQMTMYQLYEDYIVHFERNIKNAQQEKDLEISFISAGGPYRGMDVSECFNEILYQDFYKFFLLKQKISAENFSLRLNCRILLEFGKNFHKAKLIDLKKLTLDGLYISMDKAFYQDELSSEDQIRLMIQSQVLLKTLEKNIEEIQKILSPFEFNLFYTSNKKDSFTIQSREVKLKKLRDTFTPGRIDLFISYDQISIQNRDLANNLKKFINSTRSTVLKDSKALGDLAQAS